MIARPSKSTPTDPLFPFATLFRSDRTRGPAISSFLSIVRGCQDIMAMLVFGGVFERHPGLKVVCVEADAGWVPHFMYRMDHAFNRHRYWLKPGADLTRLPSEYFADHIYVTFQDDWRSEEHTSELQSLMRSSYAVFCLKKKNR